MTPSHETGNEEQTCENRRLPVGRRALLKAAGIGIVGGVAASGAASASGHYQGPFSETYEPTTIDPEAIHVDSGGSPDSEGEGEEVGRTVPRKAPEARGNPRGGGGDLQRSAPEGSLVEDSFEGLSALDVRGVVPSDAQIAAGPNDLVQAINSQVAFFSKTGDRTFLASLDAFFENVSPLIDRSNPESGFFETYIIFDPRARYDPDSGRFLVSCVDFSLVTGEGALLVAVSSSSDPSDEWYGYRIRPVGPEGVFGPGLVDYDQLGYDDEAIYLSQNFFPDAFREATLVALDKSAAYAGESADSNHFTDLRNPDGSLAFTVQPADGGGYFVNSRFFQGQTLTVWNIDDPLGTPTLENDAVRVPPYTNPTQGANQPDTEEKIDMGDDRVLRVNYDGTSLWASHTVNDGRARWYELDPSGPSVSQTGDFRENGEKTFFPAIASDGDDAVFVYNTSSPRGDSTGFVDIGVAAVDGGEVTRFEEVKAGENDYDYVDPGEGDNGTQTLRWGDYNGAVPDPDGGLWVVSQYAKQVDLLEEFDEEFIEDNFYGTWIAKVDPSGD